MKEGFKVVGIPEGVSLSFYEPGTDTLGVVYDSAGQAIVQPVLFDSAGIAVVYFHGQFDVTIGGGVSVADQGWNSGVAMVFPRQTGIDLSAVAPSLGVDDNYVTDAEKAILAQTSGTNTGDQNLTGMIHSNRAALDRITALTDGPLLWDGEELQGSIPVFDDAAAAAAAGLSPTALYALRTPPAPTATYTVTTSAGAHGSITPTASGLAEGSSKTISFTPDSNYQVASITVDGNVLAAASSYTFTNLIADHTISVTFSIVNNLPSTPTISGTGGNGTVTLTPVVGSTDVEDGTVTTFEVWKNGVKYGADQTGWNQGVPRTFTGQTNGVQGQWGLYAKDSAGMLSLVSNLVNITPSSSVSYATWSSTDKSDMFSVSSGNMVATAVGVNTAGSIKGTLGLSAGLHSFEVKIPSDNSVAGLMFGFCSELFALTPYLSQSVEALAFYSLYSSGRCYQGAAIDGPYGCAVNDVIRFNVNINAGTVTVKKNGVAIPGMTNYNFGTLMEGTTLKIVAGNDGGTVSRSLQLYTDPATFASAPDTGYEAGWGA